MKVGDGKGALAVENLPEQFLFDLCKRGTVENDDEIV